MKALLISVMVLLAGCPTTPVRQAETFEQKAYALYGTFVIFQVKAAELVQDAATPDRVKQGLRDADKAAFPVAEALVDTAVTVGEIRDIINMCEQLEMPEVNPACTDSNERRLANAIANLSTIYFKAQPIILNLAATVKGAK